MPKPGDLLAGNYVLRETLGRGAWGEVWSAERIDPAHPSVAGEPCAVKLLHPALVLDERALARFVREAAAVRRIVHPNVVRVLELAESGGAVFIAFERLEGASLASVLREPEPMPTQVFLERMVELADVLASSHAAGVVHRDLKPANLFLHVDARGLRLKLLDFGISKLAQNQDGLHTATSSFLGSPRYMSPEQVLSSATVDEKSDLWSFGVILFEGLTGTYPHRAEDIVDLLRAISHEPPRAIELLRPELDAELRALVRACLRPRISRIASAAEVRDKLAAVLARGAISEAMRLPTRLASTDLSHQQLPTLVPETLGAVTQVWSTLRTGPPDGMDG